jgi:hypothetical protein
MVMERPEISLGDLDRRVSCDPVAIAPGTDSIVTMLYRHALAAFQEAAIA